MNRLLAAALLGLLVAPGAAARTLEGSADLAPRANHELAFALDATGAITWDWRVMPDDATVAFDVHTHLPDGGVATIAPSEGTSGHGTRTLQAGNYWASWTAKAFPAHVTYTVDGPVRLPDEAPATPAAIDEKGSPAPSALLALAAGAALAGMRTARRR